MKKICKIKTILIDILTLLWIILSEILYINIFIISGEKLQAWIWNIFDMIFFWANAWIVLLASVFMLWKIIIWAIIEYKKYLNNKCK